MADTGREHTTDNILRWNEVAKRIPISRSHAHALVKQGKFLAPIKICGSRSSGWLESEIDAFIANRIAESRDARPETELPRYGN